MEVPGEFRRQHACRRRPPCRCCTQRIHPSAPDNDVEEPFDGPARRTGPAAGGAAGTRRDARVRGRADDPRGLPLGARPLRGRPRSPPPDRERAAVSGLDSGATFATEGSWPVLPSERTWGARALFGISVSAAIATWCFLIGGYVAYY